MASQESGGIVQSEMDAWKQLYELQKRYTRIYETLADGYERRDLIVRADALERCVWVHGERHNVKTIRQYIDVLEQACVFVEDANPTWAKRPQMGKRTVPNSDSYGQLAPSEQKKAAAIAYVLMTRTGAYCGSQTDALTDAVDILQELDALEETT